MSLARLKSKAVRKAWRLGARRVQRLDLDSHPRARGALLRAIAFALPRRFDPSAANDLEATFELRIRNRSTGELSALALEIAERRCTVRRGRVPRPDAVVTVGAEDVIGAAGGVVGWPELMSGGRLVLSGDPFLALRFPRLFQLSVK